MLRFARTRRILFLVGWNLLFAAVGLVLIALAGEVYLRLKVPFPNSSHPAAAGRFVPEVGLLWQPHRAVRHTNRLDFWTITRSNSLGFLDREPISPEQAAAGCHIAMIGDSFVEAREVPNADKFQTRLEEMAAEKLPGLNLTTAAFGRATTAQANQLAFYDAYARKLRPKLVVLVFYPNDFGGNSPIISALRWNWNPDRPPWSYLEKSPGGEWRLRPPHPEFAVALTPRSPLFRFNNFLAGASYFYGWLEAKAKAGTRSFVVNPRPVAPRVEKLSRRPGYLHILEGWQPSTIGSMNELLLAADPPPIFQEALELTAQSLVEFKERTERDGAALVLLSTHWMGGPDTRYSRLLQQRAAAAEIPVINQYNYIQSRGGGTEDAHFAHDGHWNDAGHQWAAEALLKYINANPEICRK